MGCDDLNALLVAGKVAIEDVGDGDEEAEDSGDGDVGGDDGVTEAEDREVEDGGGGGGREGGGGEEVEVDDGEEDEGEVGGGNHARCREDGCHRTPTLSSPIVVHHPSLHKDDSTHLVSLTSTTYSSLKTLDNPDPPLSASAATVISAWDLMDGLDDLPSSTTSSSAVKKPYFLHRSLTYHQEALLSSTAASATVRKKAIIPYNLGGSTKRSTSASRC